MRCRRLSDAEVIKSAEKRAKRKLSASAKKTLLAQNKFAPMVVCGGRAVGDSLGRRRRTRRTRRRRR